MFKNIVYLLCFCLCFSFSVSSKATGIPVVDGANLAAQSLRQIEMLFQHSQMLVDTAQEIEDFRQVIVEWQKHLETIRSLEQRFGSVFTKDALERHKEQWGDNAVATIINDMSPTSDNFALATIGLMLAETGVQIHDQNGRALILDFIDDEDTRETLSQELAVLEKRDYSYRDSLIAASSADSRNFERNKQLDSLKQGLSSLGENSEVATNQLLATATLFSAEQQQEIINLLSHMYGEMGKRNIHDNSDIAKQRQAYIETNRKQKKAKEEAEKSKKTYVDITKRKFNIK